MRTLAGAFATSLVQTGWSDATRRNQTELAGAMHHGQTALDPVVAASGLHDSLAAALSNAVEGQAVMLATLNMFGAIAVCLLFAATLIWLAPKPKGPIDTSGAH
jgi:DHA2 family multidrug resistance protein